MIDLVISANIPSQSKQISIIWYRGEGADSHVYLNFKVLAKMLLIYSVAVDQLGAQEPALHAGA